LLGGEEPGFHLNAPSIAVEFAAARDDAMARDHQSQGVCAKGGADCAHCSFVARTPRDFLVRERLSVTNLRDDLEDLLLERSRAQVVGRSKLSRSRAMNSMT